MKKIVVFLITLLFGISIVKANVSDLAINSKSAILMDYDTMEILYEKNSDEALVPASMTKIMSMLIIMEAIDNGKISLDDEVIVSKRASEMGGSQVYLQEGEKYKVHDLLKGIAIASGNDAVVAMAEYISGTVEEFVRLMNDKASDLGLKNTHFVNPHGLDEKDHYSSARDMAIMARELISHESILKYTSIYEDYLTKNDGSNIWLVNTNKLVRFYPGVDGLKTGYTENAGYCLTATAKKDDLRLIAVVMNVLEEEKRRSDITGMLNYGFANYSSNILLSKDEVIGKKYVDVFDKEVNIYLNNDYKILLKKGNEIPDYTYEIVLDNIKNNIKAGDRVGKVEVKDSNGKVLKELEAIVHEDYNKLSFYKFFIRNIKLIIGVK